MVETPCEDGAKLREAGGRAKPPPCGCHRPGRDHGAVKRDALSARPAPGRSAPGRRRLRATQRRRPRAEAAAATRRTSSRCARGSTRRASGCCCCMPARSRRRARPDRHPVVLRHYRRWRHRRPFRVQPGAAGRRLAGRSALRRGGSRGRAWRRRWRHRAGFPAQRWRVDARGDPGAPVDLDVDDQHGHALALATTSPWSGKRPPLRAGGASVRGPCLHLRARRHRLAGSGPLEPLALLAGDCFGVAVAIDGLRAPAGVPWR